jgi:hypothetical protein
MADPQSIGFNEVFYAKSVFTSHNEMSSPFYPTAPQTLSCFILCQNVTNLFLSIFIVRLDERDGSIFILAGEEVGIIITQDGLWNFTP